MTEIELKEMLAKSEKIQNKFYAAMKGNEFSECRAALAAASALFLVHFSSSQQDAEEMANDLNVGVKAAITAIWPDYKRWEPGNDCNSYYGPRGIA